MLIDESQAQTEALAAYLEAQAESPDDAEMQAACRLRDLDALCRDLRCALNALVVQASNWSSPVERMWEQATEHADEALARAEPLLGISEGQAWLRQVIQAGREGDR
jgi:hypothetical protein